MFRTYRVTGRQIMYHPDVAPTIVAIYELVRAESDDEAEAELMGKIMDNPWRDVLELRAVAA